MRRLAIVLAFAFAPAPAAAFEPLCTSTGFLTPDLEASIEAAICTSDQTSGCAYGVATARGRMLGEHALITLEAMRIAGLAALTNTPVVPRYFGDRAVAGAAGAFASVEPTGAAAMIYSIERPLTVPELSELGDLTYSVADILLGNEHCPAANAPTGTPEAVDACHTFSSHMGSINSTHFSPQNRAVYAHYHRLAIAVAQRCRAMRDALAGEHRLRDRIDAAVKSCELEALAFEAFGAHYLEDAWSSGHMWERWGSPVYAATERGRLEAHAVGLLAGLIHGWRSVARASLGISGDDQHDRLCMPGRFDPDDTEEPEVVWTYAGAEDAPLPGGGDLYVRPCMARGQNANLAVSTGPTLAPQWDRLRTCVARGFRTVYENGPRTLGDLPLPDVPDRAIADPLAPQCWDQRATNRSMALGFGIARRESLVENLDEGVLGRMVLALLPVASEQVGQLDVGPLELLDASTLLRLQAVELSIRFSAIGRFAPDGTQLASLDPDRLGFDTTLLGVPRNSAAVPLIEQGGVEYMDAPDPASWSAAAGVPCTTDADCGAGSYCDRGSTSPGAIRHCARYDAAILRAFRAAELSAWCEQTTAADLQAAGARCVELGDDDTTETAACTACAAVAIPQMRNACDEDSFLQFQALERAEGREVEPRALCDLLVEGGAATSFAAPLYVPSSPLATPELSAQSACETDGATTLVEKVAGSVTYDMDRAPPGFVDFDEAGAGGDRDDHFLCGSTVGARLIRYRHAPGTAHTHTFTVTLRPIRFTSGGEHRVPAGDLAFTLRTADCGQVITEALPEDRDGDLENDTLAITWDVASDGEEICLRIETRRPDVWASYLLSEGACSVAPVQVSAGGGHTCARLDDGTVSCWGHPSSGQLGDGMPENGPFHPQAVRALGLDRVDDVSAGAVHTCALRAGEAHCWGEGARGQLGDGLSLDRPVPGPVSGLSAITQISAGDVGDRGAERHTCALAMSTAYCFGSNLTGELGLPAGGTQAVPTAVPDLPAVVSVQAGHHYTCALDAGGTVYCFGINTFGQLGDGCLGGSPICDHADPRPVVDLAGAVDLSVGPNHACAVTAQGQAFCWGSNAEGQLGDPSPMTVNFGRSSRPVPVADLTGVTRIFAGGNHTCALAGGSVRCWGANFTGQLGDGTTSMSRVPVQVTGLGGVDAVSAGGDHTCALSGTTLFCWGSNSSGQLGRADVAFSERPVEANACPM